MNYLALIAALLCVDTVKYPVNAYADTRPATNEFYAVSADLDGDAVEEVLVSDPTTYLDRGGYHWSVYKRAGDGFIWIPDVILTFYPNGFYVGAMEGSNKPGLFVKTHVSGYITGVVRLFIDEDGKLAFEFIRELIQHEDEDDAFRERHFSGAQAELYLREGSDLVRVTTPTISPSWNYIQRHSRRGIRIEEVYCVDADLDGDGKDEELVTSPVDELRNFRHRWDVYKRLETGYMLLEDCHPVFAAFGYSLAGKLPGTSHKGLYITGLTGADPRDAYIAKRIGRYASHDRIRDMGADVHQVVIGMDGAAEYKLVQEVESDSLPDSRMDSKIFSINTVIVRKRVSDRGLKGDSSKRDVYGRKTE